MLEAVSSSAEACSWVRCDKSSLPAEICLAAEPTESAAVRTSVTIFDSFSVMFLSACMSLPSSSSRSMWMLPSSSPLATRVANVTAALSGRMIAWISNHPITAAIARPNTMAPIATARRI